MYAKIDQGTVVKFPYTLKDARKEYPRVSFPSDISVIPEDTLNVRGVYSVVQQDDPLFDPSTHKLEQGVPVEVDGSWVVTRVVVPLSQTELDRRQEAADRETLKADAQVLALLKARPNAINNYINNNVTDLASAKDVLKILARASAVLAQSVIR